MKPLPSDVESANHSGPVFVYLFSSTPPSLFFFLESLSFLLFFSLLFFSSPLSITLPSLPFTTMFALQRSTAALQGLKTLSAKVEHAQITPITPGHSQHTKHMASSTVWAIFPHARTLLPKPTMHRDYLTAWKAMFYPTLIYTTFPPSLRNDHTHLTHRREPYNNHYRFICTLIKLLNIPFFLFSFIVGLSHRLPSAPWPRLPPAPCPVPSTPRRTPT